MRSLVVYESMYGNTHAVADEIASGLESAGDVEVVTPDRATAAAVSQCDLIVVGGPTHVHGMTSARSRQAAVETAEKDPEIDLDEEASGEGLRDWLNRLPSSGGVAAAFDTRIDKPAFVTGSAAKGIAKRLRRHGYRSVVDPESFFVADTGGPLLDGEAERAREWGRALAARVSQE